MRLRILKNVKTFGLPFSIAIFTVLFLGGCESFNQDKNKNVVIEANGMKIEAPDTIASGWQTFEFKNNSDMVHFALLDKMPEGKGIEDHQKEVAPVFQNFLDDILGNELSAREAGFDLPEWYAGVTFEGGPGLLSGGLTSKTTVYMKPGTYVVECYVKSNGIFHSYNPNEGEYGMVDEIVVTGDTSSLSKPEPTIRVSLSSKNGIRMEGNPKRGDHIIQVSFEDQKVYSNFVRHDLHLAKLNDNISADSLGTWMNWMVPNGLSTPAPVEFIGGANEMPAGSLAFIHVSLEPGKYIFISEVPDPEGKGFYKEFTVSE